MEISSQAGYIQPNFAFQINTPSKMLKKLAKNDKNSKFCYIVYLRFWCFQRFSSTLFNKNPWKLLSFIQSSLEYHNLP